MSNSWLHAPHDILANLQVVKLLSGEASRYACEHFLLDYGIVRLRDDQHHLPQIKPSHLIKIWKNRVGVEPDAFGEYRVRVINKLRTMVHSPFGRLPSFTLRRSFSRLHEVSASSLSDSWTDSRNDPE